MHISELKQTGIKFFIFGGFGTGKTTFISKMPQPIYVFDFDRGMLSVASRLIDEEEIEDAKIEFDFYADNPLRRKRPSAIAQSVLANINTSPEAYLNFEDKLNEILDECEEAKENDKPIPYGTVVLDSLTTFANAFMAYVMSVNATQNRVIGCPNMNDYGNFVRKMPQVLDMFHLLNDYGIHTAITAHMQLKEDIRGPKESQTYRGIFRVPNIVGKDLPFNLGAYFDEVYHAYAVREDDEDTSYMFETKADDDLFCKSRSASMPTTIVQEWPRIERRLIGENKE